jgi:hypothetical protein
MKGFRDYMQAVYTYGCEACPCLFSSTHKPTTEDLLKFSGRAKEAVDYYKTKAKDLEALLSIDLASERQIEREVKIYKECLSKTAGA